jgi:hypothetical protein
MNISQLTEGNWDRNMAAEAVRAFYNGGVYWGADGVVMINRGGTDDTINGWVPAKDEDLKTILLYGGEAR